MFTPRLCFCFVGLSRVGDEEAFHLDLFFAVELISRGKCRATGASDGTVIYGLRCSIKDDLPPH